MSRANTARNALGALGVVLGAAALSACGAAPAPGELTVGDLRAPQPFHQARYLVQTVTVSGTVVDVPFPGEVELASPDGRPLVVLVRTPVPVRPGAAVRATGTLGQLQTTFPEDEVPYVQDSLYREATTEAYLYDATVGAG